MTPAASTQASSTAPVQGAYDVYRPGILGQAIRYRETEFLWDATYGTGLSVAVTRSLDSLAFSLSERIGASPLVRDAHNTEAIYRYLNREGRGWNSNPLVFDQSMRLGNLAYAPFDYSHADVYLNNPTLPQKSGGRYPILFFSPDEDLSSGHPSGEVLADNAHMIPGPNPAAPTDPTGTGWTAAGSPQFVNFNHELTHSFPALRNNQAGLDELWSAGAEIVGGIRNNIASSEVPYTWSLLAWTPEGAGAPSIADPNFNNRFSLSNYQGRTSFMAYVGYNFRNGDTARTLAGMTDDLLYRWNRPPEGTFADLRRLSALLSDAQCATCQSKAYFRPGGTGLANFDRLQLLHHNWRVANFVNNPGLAEGQFGFPEWGGFSPAQRQRAWQNLDGSPKTDIVALPAIVTLDATAKRRDISFQGTRSYRGMTHPMTLTPFSANYWVIRPSGGLSGENNDLVVRVSPRAFHLSPATGTPQSGNDLFASESRNRSVRLMASVVGYNIADQSTDESLLWNTPSAAVYSTEVRWVLCDSSASDIELVVPNFGLTHKAAVLIVSLADGALDKYTAVTEFSYLEALPYRIDIGLRAAGSGSASPLVVSSVPAATSDWPSWSPAADELVFSTLISAQPAYYQIYRRRLDGTSPTLIAPQAMNQFSPDWSPRGDAVVFESRPASDQSDLYLQPLGVQGAQPLRLTSQAGCELMPAFQPNGQGVAYFYTLGPGQPWSLRWVGANGLGDRVLVSNIAPTPVPPRWLPNGQTVVVYDPNNRALIRCAFTGGGFAQDALGNVDAVSFDYHPGNGRLAVSSTAPLRNFNQEIFQDNGTAVPPPPSITAARIALWDTTGTRDTLFRFVRRSRPAANVRWSPDGLSLAFSQGSDSPGNRDVLVGQVSGNHAPFFPGGVPDLEIPASVAYQTTFPAQDPDGEPVTYSANYLPSGATFGTPTANTFRWLNPVQGNYFIVLRAMDGSGGVSRHVFKLSVVNSGGGGDPLVDNDPGCGACIKSNQSFTANAVGPDDTLRDSNSYLNGALPGAWFSQTSRLSRVVENGTGDAIATLRAPMPGELKLDRVELITLDHPADATTIATSSGVLAARDLPLLELKDGLGGDWLAGVQSAASERRSLRVPAGTELTAVLPPHAGRAGISIECARDSSIGWDASDGIALLKPIKGGWTPLETVHPRKQLDLLGALVADAQTVKLLFHESTVVTNIQGFIESEDLANSVHMDRVLPTSASLEGALGSLTVRDSVNVVLAEGESITLGFPVESGTSGLTRSYFLDVRAAYIPPTGAWSARLQPAGSSTPPRFALFQNQPNPFRENTTLRFELARRSRVDIEIFDAAGRRVRQLTSLALEPGTHSLGWDGRDEHGALSRPGVYLYRMTAGGYRQQRRLVLLPH